MSGTFGPGLLGRELDWNPVGDSSGTWAYSLENEPLAMFWWSPESREVRAESGPTVWRVPFQGVFLLRGAVIEPDVEIPRLVFAGGPGRGLAEIPNGPRFTLFSQMDAKLGPWIGIDDERGNGVLRIRGRVGGGRIGSLIRVTPDRRYANLLEPLLVLWGGISVLRRKIPWLSISTLAASEASIQGAIERMLGSASR